MFPPKFTLSPHTNKGRQEPWAGPESCPGRSRSPCRPPENRGRCPLPHFVTLAPVYRFSESRWCQCPRSLQGPLPSSSHHAHPDLTQHVPQIPALFSK